MKKRIIPIVISLLLLGGIIYSSDALKVISALSKTNLLIIIFIVIRKKLPVFALLNTGN